LRLAPSSKWQVDYAEDRCRLAREFGEGETKVLAVFDKYGPDEAFGLTLAGKPMKTGVGGAEAAITFGPTEPTQKRPFFEGEFADRNALIFKSNFRIAPPSDAELTAIKNKKRNDPWIEIAPITPDREAAVRYLQIGKPLSRALILETGSLKQPFAALNKCIDELVTHWGVDVEKHKSLTRKVKPAESPDRWVVSSDYPTSMLQAGQPAIVDFRMSIGPDGKPTACHIQATTRPKAFDDAVCKSLMRRAEFEPALDAEGKPLASYWRTRVVFQIPGL
jgi:Gram-negative bacterial TonB protein C-terminal